MSTKIKRVTELFNELTQTRQTTDIKTEKLNFVGVNGFDVYNITAPFQSAGKTVIAGRVEPRDQEHSDVVFFEQIDGQWCPIDGAPSFKLQDPFFTFINDELIIGGVEVKEVEQGMLWHTVFYRGEDIFNLSHFFSGPSGMKDIRLCDMKNGRIAVFTRPQGDIGGRGTIGYTEVASLAELSLEAIDNAPLIEGMFHPMDWGGVNETHLLENGEIGLLAHVACFSDDTGNERHYYSASFIFDPKQKSFRDFKIIASRDQFQQGAAKRSDLVDVIFSSGLVFNKDTVTLYAGVSDAEAHLIEIPHPFK